MFFSLPHSSIWFTISLNLQFFKLIHFPVKFRTSKHFWRLCHKELFLGVRVGVIQMRGGYYGSVAKYEIPKFQLWLGLLFHRNTMNFSRRTPTMQCSKKQLLVVVVPFSTVQNMFCDLQKFFQIIFKH